MRPKARKKVETVALLLLLIVGALVGLVLLKEFVGYATNQLTSQAGTITAVTMDHRTSTSFWAGAFGLVFSESGFDEDQFQTFEPGEIIAYTLVFSCYSLIEPTQEIYASLSPEFNFTELRAGSVDMIDNDFLNLSEFFTDSTNNTFVNNVTISYGAQVITGIPGVFMYTNNAPNTTWFTGILNGSGELILVSRAYTSSQTSFKGTKIRYQMMLPIPNSSTRWYFHADPNDECPAGLGLLQGGASFISGYVFIANTTTPIVNASVSAGGNQTYTNGSGFYNLTVAGGGLIQTVVSIKEGFIDNITSVNTTVTRETKQNLTMDFFFGYLPGNGTISGYVRDNATNASIADVIISIEGLVNRSNQSGNYSITLPKGFYSIAAVKAGYENFVGNFTLELFQNLSYIINMTPSIGIANDGVVNGTIEGFVFDNKTNLTLPNVTVTLNGVTATTNGSGFYRITSFSGFSNLVGFKPLYDVYAEEVNITAAQTLYHNFTLNPSSTGIELPNGSLEGYIFTEDGVALSDVIVNVVGLENLTNSTGQYAFPSMPIGTHLLAATRDGFANNFSTVQIFENNVTYLNITLHPVVIDGLGPGQGVGQGPGQGTGNGAGLGPGRGPGTGLQAQSESVIEVEGFIISINRIIKKVQQDTFIELPLIIQNNLDETGDIAISVEGEAAKLIQLSSDRLFIEGHESDELVVTILGNQEPGVYEGNLIIGGDIDVEMPIYILVTEKQRVAIETLLVKVIPAKEKYTAGSELKFRLDLQNLITDNKYDVKLTYHLEEVEGNYSLFLGEEEVSIFTAYSLIKKYDIPSDVPKGRYKVKVRAEFLELESEHFAIFHIVEPFYKYALFGVLPLWILFLVLFVGSSGTFGVLYWKKKAAAKKRYAVKVDYSTLPKDGPRSAYAGKIAETNNKVYFNLDFFQVHTLIAGSTGSGKSVAAQVLVEEALKKGTSIMVFDPTAQWSGFLRKSVDQRFLNLYKDYGMKKTEAQAFNGNIRTIADPKELIDIKKFMKPGEITVFTINKLDPSDADVIVANTIKEVFHANLDESPKLRLLLVFDEVHRLLPKFGGSGQGFLQIERALREFRKWGVGLILISQVLKDFIGETKANINTTIQMRTSDETDLKRIKEDFGPHLLQSLVKSPPGTGMVQNSEYNHGNPFFVGYRPLLHNTARLSEDELDNYYKYNEMMDDLDFELEQLEQNGVDMFDFQLELKMAQDKVKSGSFHMVDIYLEGLRPRLKQQWDKLGKKPSKRVKRLVDVDLKEGLEKAKKDQEKADQPLDEIAKAKAAQQKKSEVAPPEKPSGPPSVADLIGIIDQAIADKDKIALKAGYKDLQGSYKTASADDKKLIMKKVKEIQAAMKS